MRLKFFLTMALLGLLGAQFSMAQSGLGKKSGPSQSGQSGSSSRGSSGRTSSGVKSDPGPRGGSSVRSGPSNQNRGGSPVSRGQSGNPGLGKRDSGVPLGNANRGQSNGSGSVLGRPDRTNSGNSGLGKGQNGSGSVLGRPDRTNSGNSGLGKGQNGSGSVLGRPDRTNSGNSGLGKGQNGSGSVLGRPDRTNSGNSGLGKGQNGSGSVLGRPDRTNSGNSGLGKGQNGSGSVLGRPDRGASGQIGNGNDLGKRGNGLPNNGSHNGYGSVKPSNVRSIPKVGPSNRIVREVNRENRVHTVDNRYRNGYWAYNRGWCDTDFHFGRYGYTWYDGCSYVPSPFYWYYHLPPYLDYTCVRIGPITWISCSTRYQWYAPTYNNLGYYDRNRGNQLDYAVDNIRLAFDRQSMRYLYDLVPDGGRVEIEAEGGEGYTVSSSDFAEMLRDLVESTSTVDYRIVDVYRDGDRATVVADHRYRDSFGDERCVRHTYGLRARHGGYEIAYFKSIER